MHDVFLLVPSPLLGPATWRPVEVWLREQGHDARTVDFGPDSRTPKRIIDSVVAAAAGEPVVLVPHSNAGLYAPYLTTLVDVGATVFVDAAMPSDTQTRDTPLAPPGMLDLLRSLADTDAMLPPWTHWWDDVADLFPDVTTREAVEREQPRLPLAYFTSRIPVPANWTNRPAAYLAFGETYAEERDRARREGWPTRTLAGDHLHQLHDPAAVGSAVLDLDRTVATH